MLTEGSAYLDRSGRVLVTDEPFRTLLGLGETNPGRDLQERARGDAVLAALLAGEGADHAELPAAGALPGVEMTRVRGEGGTLLRVAPQREQLPASSGELAVQAITLGRLAGSVAHEVKNPLNAMALQVALLGDKIATASEALGVACAGNLASIKTQIGRINEVVRRYVDIADPPISAGFDAGGLLVDAASLFGHEARRRRITLTCEATPATVRAGGDGSRAARVVLGLFWRALSATPAGGHLLARAAHSGTGAVLSLEHPPGEPDGSLSWMEGVLAAAAREMGGKLEDSCKDGRVRTALVLSKESAS